MVEGRKDTLIINNFMKDAKRNRQHFPIPKLLDLMCDECDRLLDEERLKSKIRDLLIYRNSLVAHQNYEMPTEMGARGIPVVTIGDPEVILDGLRPVLVKLHTAIYGSSSNFEDGYPLSKTHFDQILNLLSKHLEWAD